MCVCVCKRLKDKGIEWLYNGKFTVDPKFKLIPPTARYFVTPQTSVKLNLTKHTFINNNNNIINMYSYTISIHTRIDMELNYRDICYSNDHVNVDGLHVYKRRHTLAYLYIIYIHI